MNLPVLNSELPETLRLDFARNDLAMIAAQAHEQVTVHEHAARAATEVLHAAGLIDVAGSDKLLKLKKRYQEPHPDNETPTTPSGLARQMIVSRKPQPSGVAERDVTQDVLAELHPDKLPVSAVDETKTNVFKAITEARQHEDSILEQGLYAGTVAARAMVVESPTATKLERTRYKAWLALQAGKGQFDSIEEVDAWKKRELELMPYKMRAGLLFNVRELYVRSLGADSDGSIRLPAAYYGPISLGLDASGQVIERVMSDEVTQSELAGVDMELFDTKFGRLVEQLDPLLKNHEVMRHSLHYFGGEMAASFGRELAEAARVLEGHGLYARIAIKGLYSHFGATPPDSSILSNENKYNNIIHFKKESRNKY